MQVGNSEAVKALAAKALLAVQGKQVNFTGKDVVLARQLGITDIQASAQGFRALLAGVGKGRTSGPVGKSLASYKAQMAKPKPVSDDPAVNMGRRFSHILNNGTPQQKAFLRLALAGGLKEGLAAWKDCPYRSE